MRIRVAGAFSTINYGIRPFGAIVGGLLGTLIGLRATCSSPPPAVRYRCSGYSPHQYEASTP